MNFYLYETNYNKSQLILNSDLSFMTINSEKWDFQVSIRPYFILLLNFNYDLKFCTGIEGYFLQHKCTNKKLQLKIVKKGILKVDKFPTTKDACGTTYFLRGKNFYYDKESKIFGVGSTEGSNEVFEIGKGQYVKLKDGELIALFVQF